MKITKTSALQIGISVILTGFLVFALIIEQKDHSFFDIVASVKLSGLATYVAMGLVGLFFRTLRYRLLLTNILGAEKTPTFGIMLLITTVRNALADFLPARLGELGYIYLLHRAGVPIATGAASFGFAFVLDIGVLALMFVFFFGVIPYIFPEGIGGVTIGPLQASMVIVGLLFFIWVLTFVVRKLPTILTFVAQLMLKLLNTVPWLKEGKISKLWTWLEENVEHIAADVDTFVKNGSLGWLTFYTFMLRVCKYGSLYVLLLAVVHQFGLTANEIHPGLSLFAFVLAEASASLPISGIMGFGAYESAWNLVFSLSHVTIPAAFSVSFVVHLITQVKGYSLGILAMGILLLLQVKGGDSKKTQQSK